MSKRSAPELLADMAAHATEILKEIGKISHDEAEVLAWAVTDRIAENWGGQSLYIPRGCILGVEKEHLDIFNDFNGHNHSELAQKYKKSVIWIYAVVKRVRQQLLARRQGGLFDNHGVNDE